MSSDTTTAPADAGKSERPSRPTFSAGHYFVLVVLVGIGLLAVTGKEDESNLVQLLDSLYSPISIVVLIVIGAMYTLQKSSDRSRIYRIELREMRRRRLEDLQFYRQIERDLASIADQWALDDSQNRASAGSPTAEGTTKLRQDMENVIDRLRNHG